MVIKMAQILIIVCIIIFYYNRKRIRDSGGAPGNRSMPNTTVTSAGSASKKPAAGNPYAGNTGNSGGYTGRAGIPAARGGVKQTAHNRRAQAAIQEAKEDGHSTTAYLMEKAEADAREHEREKYEEQRRLYETRGGLAVAERFLDGDSIPQGRRCVRCGYCGADNLIPTAAKIRYSCYFCREPIN